MTNNEIIAQTFIFFLAGYETTATTITASIWLLMKNPGYVERIREEANRAKVTDCASLTEANLPLISALVSETLRLVPPLSPHIRVAKGKNKKDIIRP